MIANEDKHDIIQWWMDKLDLDYAQAFMMMEVMTYVAKDKVSAYYITDLLVTATDGKGHMLLEAELLLAMLRG